MATVVRAGDASTPSTAPVQHNFSLDLNERKRIESDAKQNAAGTLYPNVQKEGFTSYPGTVILRFPGEGKPVFGTSLNGRGKIPAGKTGQEGRELAKMRLYAETAVAGVNETLLDGASAQQAQLVGTVRNDTNVFNTGRKPIQPGDRVVVALPEPDGSNTVEIVGLPKQDVAVLEPLEVSQQAHMNTQLLLTGIHRPGVLRQPEHQRLATALTDASLATGIAMAEHFIRAGLVDLSGGKSADVVAEAFVKTALKRYGFVADSSITSAASTSARASAMAYAFPQLSNPDQVKLLWNGPSAEAKKYNELRLNAIEEMVRWSHESGRLLDQHILGTALTAAKPGERFRICVEKHALI